MRQSIACVAVTLAAALLPVHARQSPVATPPGKDAFHIVLLVGQSNMAGRGTVEPQDVAPIASVLALDKARAWVPAVDPMHFDKPIAGVGLGRSFAARLVESRPSVTIGLVPAAVGGSPIDAWQPGAYYEPTKSHPWDDAIARVQAARAAGTLKAILWHQGESDATPGLAPSYESKLHALIGRFRQTLTAPDLPFIVGQLGQYADVPWDDARRTVDAAHRQLPDKVRQTAFVSSDGLVHNGDKVHFDSASLRELGRRYAVAYERLVAR